MGILLQGELIQGWKTLPHFGPIAMFRAYANLIEHASIVWNLFVGVQSEGPTLFEGPCGEAIRAPRRCCLHQSPVFKNPARKK